MSQHFISLNVPGTPSNDFDFTGSPPPLGPGTAYVLGGSIEDAGPNNWGEKIWDIQATGDVTTVITYAGAPMDTFSVTQDYVVNPDWDFTPVRDPTSGPGPDLTDGSATINGSVQTVDILVGTFWMTNSEMDPASSEQPLTARITATLSRSLYELACVNPVMADSDTTITNPYAIFPQLWATVGVEYILPAGYHLINGEGGEDEIGSIENVRSWTTLWLDLTTDASSETEPFCAKPALSPGSIGGSTVFLKRLGTPAAIEGELNVFEWVAGGSIFRGPPDDL